MKMQHAETDLGFIDRLHRKGVTWLILFVVFLAADPSSSFLYKLLNSIAFLMEVMLLVAFVNKVLIRYLLARQKTMIFIILSFFAVLFWAFLSAIIRVFLLIHVAKTPIEEISKFLSKLLDVKEIFIIHPILLIDTAHPFMLTLALDFVLLLFCLISGLLLNVVFYRLGTIGGFSFIGILALIPIMIVIFEWYIPLWEVLSEASIIAILGGLLIIIALIYSVIIGALRKASAIPA